MSTLWAKRDGCFKRPMFQPPQHCGFADADSPSPFGRTERHPVKGDAQSCVPVVVLLFAISPFAVIGAVAFVVVDSLKRHAVRWQAHISSEIGRIVPALANNNAAPAVPAESMELGVVAAVHHPAPNGVGALCAADTQPVRCLSLPQRICRRLFSQTPARPSEPVDQVLINLGGHLPALALAQPSCLPVNNQGADCLEATELAAREVVKVVRSFHSTNSNADCV